MVENLTNHEFNTLSATICLSQHSGFQLTFLKYTFCNSQRSRIAVGRVTEIQYLYLMFASLLEIQMFYRIYLVLL